MPLTRETIIQLYVDKVKRLGEDELKKVPSEYIEEVSNKLSENN